MHFIPRESSFLTLVKIPLGLPCGREKDDCPIKKKEKKKEEKNRTSPLEQKIRKSTMTNSPTTRQAFDNTFPWWKQMNRNLPSYQKMLGTGGDALDCSQSPIFP